MRLVFLGSPAFALPTLEALRAAGYELALVVTQPDRLAGRGRNSTPTPVAAYARQHALRLWQTTSLKGPEAEARLREVDAQAMVLAAFAALVPDNLLNLTPTGILNVHPSLLPRWRGAAPIQSTLLAGDVETGVSIIRLVHALDAGPLLLQERLPVHPTDDFVSLEPRLADLGARLAVRALAERPEPRPQPEAGVTFSRRIQREDARIDWAQPNSAIWNQVRAYRGWPQAYTLFEGRVLKVLRAWPITSGDSVPAEATQPSLQVERPPGPPGMVSARDGSLLVATGSGLLRLDEVQLEGKRAQSGEAFTRGYPRVHGAKLA
ncbi:MAG: methionyl-tRNA formyltransferase [Chloroflexota bacterium]|nr:methionyl-tRNA formyltransferase [Chloroflexota bacterium]